MKTIAITVLFTVLVSVITGALARVCLPCAYVWVTLVALGVVFGAEKDISNL